MLSKIVFIEGANGFAPSVNGTLAREITEEQAEMTLDQNERFVSVYLLREKVRYRVPVTALSQLWASNRKPEQRK